MIEVLVKGVMHSYVDSIRSFEARKSELIEMGFKDISMGLDSYKKYHLDEIKETHADVIKKLSGSATTEERDTWPVQLEAAKAFLSNKASGIQKQMIDSLILEGENKNELSKNIIAKHAAMQILIGLAGGLKRQTTAAVKQAESVEAVDTAMSEASQKMATAMAQFKQAMTAAKASREGES